LEENTGLVTDVWFFLPLGDIFLFGLCPISSIEGSDYSSTFVWEIFNLLFCKLLELGGASPRKDALPEIGTTSPHERLGDLGENIDLEPCLLYGSGL
jgi:hypothetical protein